MTMQSPHYEYGIKYQLQELQDNPNIDEYKLQLSINETYLAIKRLLHLSNKDKDTYTLYTIEHIFEFLNGLGIIHDYNKKNEYAIMKFSENYLDYLNYNEIWEFALLDTEFYPYICKYVTGSNEYIHFDRTSYPDPIDTSFDELFKSKFNRNFKRFVFNFPIDVKRSRW